MVFNTFDGDATDATPATSTPAAEPATTEATPAVEAPTQA